MSKEGRRQQAGQATDGVRAPPGCPQLLDPHRRAEPGDTGEGRPQKRWPTHRATSEGECRGPLGGGFDLGGDAAGRSDQRHIRVAAFVLAMGRLCADRA